MIRSPTRAALLAAAAGPRRGLAGTASTVGDVISGAGLDCSASSSAVERGLLLVGQRHELGLLDDLVDVLDVEVDEALDLRLGQTALSET